VAHTHRSLGGVRDDRSIVSGYVMLAKLFRYVPVGPETAHPEIGVA
jgi:hypothetical protein